MCECVSSYCCPTPSPLLSLSLPLSHLFCVPMQRKCCRIKCSYRHCYFACSASCCLLLFVVVALIVGCVKRFYDFTSQKTVIKWCQAIKRSRNNSNNNMFAVKKLLMTSTSASTCFIQYEN